VISYYLELVKKFMLPAEMANKVHIFNTYLIEKLILTKKLEIDDIEDPELGRWA